MQKVFRLLERVGLAEGVANLVNGAAATVNAILDHPVIQAITLVGSTPVARHVYERAAANGKRVQAQGGAKNPLIILPDADTTLTTTILMGGAVAWTYAGQHPQLVEKLILIDAAGYPRPSSQRFFGLLRLPGSEFLLRWFAPRFVVAMTLRSVYADPAKVDDVLIDRYRDLVRREGNRAAVIDRLEAFKPDLALLAKIDMPVLVMWGGMDRIVVPADAFRFQNDIKDTTLKVYSDLGHVPMEENPELTAGDARKFLLGR